MLDKNALLAPNVSYRNVTIPAKGDVKVRGLTRQEMFDVGKLKELIEIERQAIALGLVDPVLTVDEVAQWQKTASANEIQPVASAINELSGISSDAAKAIAKETYKSL